MPPAREIFRQTASAAPEAIAPCSATVSSIAMRTGTRSRTSRSAAIPETGSSTSSSPARASTSIVATASSTVHAPLASIRIATWSPTARAHRRDARRVVPDADLDLDAREAQLRGARGRLGGARAVGRADRRVDRDVLQRAVGQQRGDRLARAPAGGVPEREVDGRQRLGQVGDLAAGVQQRRAGAAAVVGEHLGVALQRLADDVERHAVVGLQRRGLAAAGDAVGPGQREDVGPAFVARHRRRCAAGCADDA